VVICNRLEIGTKGARRFLKLPLMKSALKIMVFFFILDGSEESQAKPNNFNPVKSYLTLCDGEGGIYFMPCQFGLLHFAFLIVFKCS
jgi:hypothetical protein